ncbi:hypothetical protein AB1N83_011155 [Pleurotus pulmonarius]
MRLRYDSLGAASRPLASLLSSNDYLDSGTGYPASLVGFKSLRKPNSVTQLKTCTIVRPTGRYWTPLPAVVVVDETCMVEDSLGRITGDWRDPPQDHNLDTGLDSSTTSPIRQIARDLATDFCQHQGNANSIKSPTQTFHEVGKTLNGDYLHHYCSEWVIYRPSPNIRTCESRLRTKRAHLSSTSADVPRYHDLLLVNKVSDRLDGLVLPPYFESEVGDVTHWTSISNDRASST